MTIALNIISLPSPNHDSREGVPIDMLVLHYTGMKTGAEAIDRLCDSEAKVSAHYVVEEDGRVFALVDESSRAWHAGVASWRGHRAINARSIGIEIVNPGHEWGYRDFPLVQMQAVAALCKGILSRHSIPARNVVGHSDVAPARKEDPGERFDWKWLAGQGIGLWPDVPAASGKGCDSAADIQKKLAEYGYEMAQSGVWDEQTRLCVVAFQRHFRPQVLSGEWDAECDAILDGLFSD